VLQNWIPAALIAFAEAALELVEPASFQLNPEEDLRADCHQLCQIYPWSHHLVIGGLAPCFQMARKARRRKMQRHQEACRREIPLLSEGSRCW